jgi:HSP20 family protein
MAKKEKEGNGANLAERTPQQKSLAQPAEQGHMPGMQIGHPLNRLRQEMDLLFDRFFGRWPMAGESGWHLDRIWGMNVEETDNDILVRAEAPGFEPKDFDIHVSGNHLTIEAEHKEEAGEKGGGSPRSERYSRYQRSIPLSTGVNADKVEAHYRNGVLEVRLPRTEPSAKRRIEVKT